MNSILELIPAVMGLPTISESMDLLIQAMNKAPNLGFSTIQSWAKVIGLCIALGVGANECFQMMLGRRGLDVMKLLHIIIISFCITFSGSIAELAVQPGLILEEVGRNLADTQVAAVSAKEEEVATLQEEYINKVREQLSQLEENAKAEDAAKHEGMFAEILNSLDTLLLEIQNRMKEAALLAETKICEWINTIIRFIGEVLFQVAFYGMLLGSRIFMHIVSAFGSIMFAISLAPHYKSAWSQWLSKLISLSLWGFVAYVCLYYVEYFMELNLDRDISSYNMYIGNLSASTTGDTKIGAIGMQAIGTTCMYVVALLLGVRVLAFVPEVASWLMPGGVASGAGGAAAGVATSAGMMAGNAAGAIAGGAVSGSSSAAMSGAKYMKDQFTSGANHKIEHYSPNGF